MYFEYILEPQCIILLLKMYLYNVTFWEHLRKGEMYRKRPRKNETRNSIQAVVSFLTFMDLSQSLGLHIQHFITIVH